MKTIEFAARLLEQNMRVHRLTEEWQKERITEVARQVLLFSGFPNCPIGLGPEYYRQAILERLDHGPHNVVRSGKI